MISPDAPRVKASCPGGGGIIGAVLSMKHLRFDDRHTWRDPGIAGVSPQALTASAVKGRYFLDFTAMLSGLVLMSAPFSHVSNVYVAVGYGFETLVPARLLVLYLTLK